MFFASINVCRRFPICDFLKLLTAFHIHSVRMKKWSKFVNYHNYSSTRESKKVVKILNSNENRRCCSTYSISVLHLHKLAKLINFLFHCEDKKRVEIISISFRSSTTIRFNFSWNMSFISQYETKKTCMLSSISFFAPT